MGPEEGQLCAKCTGAVLERSCGRAEPGRSRPWTPTKPCTPRAPGQHWASSGAGVHPTDGVPLGTPAERTTLDPSLPGRSPRVQAQHTLRASMGACGLTDGTPWCLPGNAWPVESAEQSRSGTQVPPTQRGHGGTPGRSSVPACSMCGAMRGTHSHPLSSSCLEFPHRCHIPLG